MKPKQIDEKRWYTLLYHCKNCGHVATVRVAFGREKPQTVRCSCCGCETMRPH